MRDYRILGDDITVSLSGERQDVPAPGVEGGADGETGLFMLDPSGIAKDLPSAGQQQPLSRDGVLRIATPGGGGYGDPKERDRERIRYDVANGFVSAEAARRDYGLE